MKMEIHLTRLILPAVCAVGLMGVPAFATMPQRTMRERGTIDSIDTQTGQLTVKDARTHSAEVFNWDQNTRFLERHHRMGRSKPVQPSDLTQGERVAIRYEKEGDSLLARKVVVTRTHHAAVNPPETIHS
jgi:hypothetical protein